MQSAKIARRRYNGFSGLGSVRRHWTADTCFSGQSGLAETGPSRNYSSEIGWRITDDGWRCMYGETIVEILTKPAGVKTYPFVIWKWPVDPSGKRRIM